MAGYLIVITSKNKCLNLKRKVKMVHPLLTNKTPRQVDSKRIK